MRGTLKNKSMKISAYLYDASGTDETVELTEEVCAQLDGSKMLWIDVSERKSETLLKIASLLKLKNVPVNQILAVSERPKLDKYENFYRFFIISVDTSEEETLKSIGIDFIVGNNFVVTIHDGEVPYFQEFHELEKGETTLGELDTEGFITTFLDLHIVSYFRAIEKIEHQVDRFDERILRTNMDDKKFLGEMVKLRRNASKLRHWFVPQRDVFYALSRPDFRPTAESEYVADTFENLNLHFENAIDAIENTRETVLSLFDLYTTRATHKMNNLMKSLTFVTVIVGTMSVISGIFGMNFEAGFFRAGNGFWDAVAGMIVLAGILTGTAKYFDWI